MSENEKLLQLEQRLLELETKHQKLVEEHQELIRLFREQQNDGGVYLEAVPEFYRKQLESEINSFKQK